MTQNAETPRGLTGAFPEDSATGGSSAATVAQPTGVPRGSLSARPMMLVTRGRIEYLTRCPGCDELHRHTALGTVTGPCGAQYELQPRRGEAA